MTSWLSLAPNPFPTIDLPPNVVKHQFRAILSNLINNAVEAIGSKSGQVLLEAASRDGVLQIRINDNGCGIPPARKENIFEKGVTSKIQGTGYGLFHARQYLSQWGGKIECLPIDPGQGSTFEITLPLSKAPTWFAENLEVRSKRNIVVLDDDVLIHKVWKERLQPTINGNITKLHFAANESEFEACMDQIGSEISESMILCDYDLSREAPQTPFDPDGNLHRGWA